MQEQRGKSHIVKMENNKQSSKGRFIKIRAHESGDEFVIFSRISTTVKDPKTGEVLAVPTGGKAHIKAEILELL